VTERGHDVDVPESGSPFWRCPYCGASLDEPPGALGLHGPTCPDCQRTADAPDHPYYGTVGAVEYGFDDVTPADRAEAADILIGASVPYRWDDGYRLFVGPESEAEVDKLFGQPVAADDQDVADDAGFDDEDLDDEDLDDAGPDDEGGEPASWVADEEAAGALARLFDAADRLRHHSDDEDAGAELADAAGVVLIAPVPFAVNGVLWATAGMLARQLLELFEAHADGDDIVAGANALRAVLVDHV
jgi:hypothetical protein